MRSRTDFTPSTLGDVDQLLVNLRTGDMEEMVALHGYPFDDIVRAGIMRSDAAWTVWIDGKLAAVFGVSGVPSVRGLGVPWLLGTPHLERHGSQLVRHGRQYVDHMLSVYPALANYVSAENERSIRWLENLGFSIDPPAPLGPYGAPFRRFHKGFN